MADPRAPLASTRHFSYGSVAPEESSNEAPVRSAHASSSAQNDVFPGQSQQADERQEVQGHHSSKADRVPLHSRVWKRLDRYALVVCVVYPRSLPGPTCTDPASFSDLARQQGLGRKRPPRQRTDLSRLAPHFSRSGQVISLLSGCPTRSKSFLKMFVIIIQHRSRNHTTLQAQSIPLHPSPTAIADILFPRHDSDSVAHEPLFSHLHLPPFRRRPFCPSLLPRIGRSTTICIPLRTRHASQARTSFLFSPGQTGRRDFYCPGRLLSRHWYALRHCHFRS
jgi:hypothetical protein